MDQQTSLDPRLTNDDHSAIDLADSAAAGLLVEVAARVYGDFADRTTLAEVLAVVARARNDLDTPSAAALPELLERLVRRRLADRFASAAPGNG